MRLVCTQQESSRHADACTTVAASLGGEIISGGDDSCVWRWTAAGDPIAKAVEADSCVTVVSWLPGSGRKKGAEAARDGFIAGFADGKLSFVSANSGRVEKRVDAHVGAVTALAWSPDGTTLVTSGEDGTVKVWSQSGILRSTLVTAAKCIYNLVWGAESADFGGDCVLYTTGPDVTVKPLSPAVKKQLQWRAHSGTVLCVDWSRMASTIVTGGEDGTFRVWDQYGRNLFTSAAGEYPVTAVSFSPDGEMFAVGSFMSLRVCDVTGWTQCRETTSNSGSLCSLGWTPDSTQVVVGCGSGSIMIAQLVDRVKHWRNLKCALTDRRKLQVSDVVNDTSEELEQRDTIVKISMGFGFLIVATTTQCSVYDVTRWNQPTQFDLRDAVVAIQQTERSFFLADCTQGIQIYSYEGRQTAVVKVAAAVRPEQLASHLLSLSKDTAAVRDPADPKRILFYDALNGKLNKDTVLAHHMDITHCALSQFGAQAERKIFFIDRNRDLYLATVHARHPTQKLATMVSSACWNDTTEALVAIADGRLVTWYYPSAVFIDRDLLPRTKHVREDTDREFGRNDHLADFFGTRVSVRRGDDGALLTFAISPYPALLFANVAKSDWDGAIRLCRFLREDALWAILAGIAVKAGELHTAEVAYAALDEIDKLRFIVAVKEIPTPEGRQAELSLFQRRPDEAERILTQAGLTYRAIEMHMGLHQWERALEIAVERRTHVDTVVAHRQKHLESIGRKENIDKFRQAGQNIKVDWDTINDKVKQELAKEKQRGKPYQAPTTS